MPAWTSRAAPSMLRSRPNCSVMRVEPSELCDVISLTSAIWPKMSLERRRDRGRHGVGAGAGHVGLNRDDRKIDLRQRRNRQLRIAQESRKHDADRQQYRRDRSLNEDLGKAVVHGASVGVRRIGGAHSKALAEPLEEEIDDRGRIERQHLAEHETADDGQAQRTAKLRADAGPEHQRQRAENRRDRRHQDRAQAQEARLKDRFARRRAPAGAAPRARSRSS